MRRLVLVALALAGCATGYHQAGAFGGYSETQINERSYDVRFEGNGYTTSSVANQGAMRRAAELAAQRGFFGFMVARQNDRTATSLYSTPVSCSAGNCSGGNAQLINRPESTLTVTLVTWDEYQRAPPGTLIYDARMILAQPQNY